MPSSVEDVGLLGMELYFPRTCVRQEDLEVHDGVPAGKYTSGLMQTEMSFCGDNEDINSICLTAVKSLLEKYNVDPKNVGRLEVGTETLIDKSKSVKTELMSLFAESGNTDIEGVTNVNACYGGTAAVFNSVAWVQSAFWDGRYAIAVAADIAVYEKGAARPTGGVGAVAMLIGPDAPLVLEPGMRSSFSENVYDFYKPVDVHRGGSEYPMVNGKLSQDSYLRALGSCYDGLTAKSAKLSGDPEGVPLSFDYMVLHSPYNKLVQKAFAYMAYRDAVRSGASSSSSASSTTCGIPSVKTNPDLAALCAKVDVPASFAHRDLDMALRKHTSAAYKAKVVPSTHVSKVCGNMYTATVWAGLASLLTAAELRLNEGVASDPAAVLAGSKFAPRRILMYSYGSGAVASLFAVKVRASVTPIVRNMRLLCRLAERKVVTPAAFEAALALRATSFARAGYTPKVVVEGECAEEAISGHCYDAMFPGTYYLAGIDSLHRRSYRRVPVMAEKESPLEAHGYSKEQIRQMYTDRCIGVDEDDNQVGGVTKEEGHVNWHIRGGLLHRAFSVFLFNEDGELLIQKRAVSKITFPSYWANTCCSHPRFFPDETVEDDFHTGVKTACRRRLNKELGVPESEVELEDFHVLTRIHYGASSDDIWGEHEVDYIVIIQKNVTLDPDPEEVVEIKWLKDPSDLMSFLNTDVTLKQDTVVGGGSNTHADKTNLISPWFRLVSEHHLPEWWNNLGPNLTKECADMSKVHKYEMTDQRTVRNAGSVAAAAAVSEGAAAAAVPSLSDAELVSMVVDGKLASHSLERVLASSSSCSSSYSGSGQGGSAQSCASLRAVKIRREALCRQQVAAGNNCVAVGIAELPLESGSGSSGGGSGGGSIPCGPPCLDYLKVQGTCCESVIGYLTVPVGAVGPLLLDGTTYTVPFATTEGALVASTTRGCKAICMSPGGATSAVLNDGMTRSPVVRVPSLACAARLKAFVESPDTFTLVKAAFDSTSRFARLKECKAAVAGRDVHLRFRALTGDAMGMNMISKGTEAALNAIIEYSDEAGGGSRPFAAMRPVALSGNMCTDKKASSMNWIEGRGKAVCVEVIIPSAVVRSVLKTTVAALVEVNTRKNLIGSALAGTVGGNNAHAANMVTAVFLATGQDPAQNVESSQCMTLLEAHYPDDCDDYNSQGGGGGAGGTATIAEGEGRRRSEPDLYACVNMPSIEVGTVGGGTVLPSQAACLKMLGLHGATDTSSGLSGKESGSNARTLATVVAGTVLAGELSLLAALTTGDLVKAHVSLNRAGGAAAATTPTPPVPIAVTAAGAGSTASTSSGTTDLMSSPTFVQRAGGQSQQPAAAMSPGGTVKAAMLPLPPRPTPPMAALAKFASGELDKQGQLDVFEEVFRGVAWDIEETVLACSGGSGECLLWVRDLVWHAVPGGKMNCGITVVHGLMRIRASSSDEGEGGGGGGFQGGGAGGTGSNGSNSKCSAEEIYQACMLGWAIELLQAFFLVADDVMANSTMRRGRPCWFRRDDVKLDSVNDSFILESAVYITLKKHLGGHPRYTLLLDLFHSVSLQTELGQLLDLKTAPAGGTLPPLDFGVFTAQRVSDVAQYKTAYYMFYLPVVCALALGYSGGEYDWEAHLELVSSLCVDMGIFFQAQDDYLDCFGDQQFKVSTDIEEGKCSWLFVRAMDRLSEEKQTLLKANYAQDDGEKVKIVKALFSEVGIETLYHEFEVDAHRAMIERMNELPEPHSLLLHDLLAKVFKVNSQI